MISCDDKEISEKIDSVIKQKIGPSISDGNNFLEIGGNSIVAATVIGELNRVFGLNIAIGTLLDLETIGDFKTLVLKEVLASGVSRPEPKRQQAGDKIKVKQWPLTPDQESWIFLDSLYPNDPALLQYGAVRLSGDFQYDALVKAHIRACARHPMLRARLTVEGDQVQQYIVDQGAQLDKAQMISENALITELNQQIRKGIRIYDSPLYDLQLFESPGAAIVLVKMHRVIADDLSVNLFLQELLADYSFLTGGSTIQTSDPTAEFLEYINELQTSIRTKAETETEYWRHAFAGWQHESVDHRPFDQVIEKEKFAGVQFVIPAELIDQTLQNAKEKNTSIFNYLYTTFIVLLYMKNQRNQFLVGCSFSKRNKKSLQTVIGNFNDTLLIKNDMDPGISFSQLLIKNQSASGESFAHTSVPLIYVIRKLEKESRIPPITTMFNMIPALQLPIINGSQCKQIALFNGSGVSDLSFNINQINGEYGGEFIYSKNRYNPTLIQEFADGFLKILGQTKNPDNLLVNFLL